MKRDRLALVLCCCGLAAGAASASIAPPLLEIQTERLDVAGPAILGTADSSLSIDRDGTTEFRSVQRDALHGTSYTTTVLRGPAPIFELGLLRGMLASARPGTFPSHCIGPPLPLGSDRRIRLIWYSQAQRSARTEVDFSSGDACPDGLISLLQAADALARAFAKAPSTVIESSPCSTDRQCTTGLKCCYSGGIPGLPHLCMRPASDGQCPAFP